MTKIIFFGCFKNLDFWGRIMEFQVQFWHPSDLRLWRTGCAIYVQIDCWNSNVQCCWTCLQRKISKIIDPSIPQNCYYGVRWNVLSMCSRVVCLWATEVSLRGRLALEAAFIYVRLWLSPKSLCLLSYKEVKNILSLDSDLLLSKPKQTLWFQTCFETHMFV